MKIFLMVGLLSMPIHSALHASELTLTEKDTGKEVVLRKGDLLTVELPSNPTTGYSWSTVSSGQSHLALVSTAYLAAEKSKGIVGSGGVATWTFKALEAGSLKMTFSYARSWEHGIPAARLISWPITVKP